MKIFIALGSFISDFIVIILSFILGFKKEGKRIIRLF